ncbi:MAG: hypothetical protein IT537_15375 [Hyphomicrobiales bacterium]|nr:hypothetical protein [Hyphomicrobiales bacterium]
MTDSRKRERSMLSYEEYEAVLCSHHPEIYDVGLDELKALRQRLRNMRNTERTLARENRRVARGKAVPRGGSFPGTAEHPLQRKQVFAAALKRVSKEICRMEKLHARTAHVEAARRALAMRRAAWFPSRPATGDTPAEGMRPSPNERRRTRTPPAKIGSVSQAMKNWQAARDSGNRG